MGRRTEVYAAEPAVTFDRTLPPQWADRLVEAQVDTVLGRPAEAVLRFRDPGHGLLDACRVRVQRPLTVETTGVAGRTRLAVFRGEVVALETEVDADGTFTTVRAMDRGHRLMRGRRVAAYVDRTFTDVTRELAAQHGLQVGTVDGGGERIPHLAQPNLTDWELLAHFAEERGRYLSVRDRRLDILAVPPASSAPSAGAAADGSPFVLHLGRNLRSVRAVVSAVNAVSAVQVRGWDPEAKRPVTHLAEVGGDGRTRPGWPARELASAFGGHPRLLVSGRPYTTARQVSAAARALADEAAAGTAELEAEVTGTPQLAAGQAVTLSGIGAPFAGQYVVTACRHGYDGESGYRTRVWVGRLPPPVVPPPPPLCGLGVATGTVVDIKEPGQGERGAVRLRLPWLSQEYVTDWVRTLHFGGQGGGVFSPEAGDEVLVGFEHGRLDRPYVLGGLYNGVDAPTKHDMPLVDATTGRLNRRSLVSRAGDRMELLSAAEQPQGVRLATGDGKVSVHLDRKNTAMVVSTGGGDTPVLLQLDGRERQITLDAGAEGTVTVRAGTVRFEAVQDGGSGGALVLSGKDVTVAATGTLKLSGEDVTATATDVLTLHGDTKTGITGTHVDIN
ncbi:VgrG-related protein [Streptomyces griseoviridis]|uniref:VgrG-related protein n=1 Tax=Streptomyces TaxID=1883 RepID=UPI002475B98D|nr:VgrG-related protein [Streptomyces sp. MAA16]MDH6699536.1 phage protein D [Streptomyces sp. MAA16]